jgi:hypothetical protein
MSFIQKSDVVVVNSKLTNKGRLLLASGSLTFNKIEFGDSEIDYNFLRDNQNIIEGNDLLILRPKDLNPNIQKPIPISDVSTETKADITTITPEIRIVRNTANQRGFFTGISETYTSLTTNQYIKGLVTVDISGVTGNYDLTFNTTSSMTENDMVLIDWRNPNLTSFNDLTGVISSTTPRLFIWYKILSITSNTVTVDKPLPNFDGNGDSIKSLGYVFPKNNAIDNFYSTGTSISYWNDNTLAFNSNCNIANDDVLVWNFNIVYKDTPAGIKNGYIAQYYDGAVFSGLKQYLQPEILSNSLLNEPNTGRTMLGIIHFTNKTINNYYGEGFSNNTFRISLPTVMYHAKIDTTMGIELVCQGLKKTQPTQDPNFITEYYDLAESTSQNIVGKVFNDLKIAIIEDEEILAALSLKSGRNYTLPDANFSTVNSLNNTTPLIDKATTATQYLAITYALVNENIYDLNISYGFPKTMYCNYIKKFYPENRGKDIQFVFNLNDLQFLQSSLNNGFGYNANKFYIISQLVPIGSEPTPENWRIFDYTNQLLDFGTWGSATIPAANLANTQYRFTKANYDSSVSYDIEDFVGTLPTTLTPLEGLGFGEESILHGNINTDIKAEVFRTKIFQRLNFNQYNTSINETFEDGDNVFISEVGIYDNNNELVIIGKMNNPIKKNNFKLFTIELDLDF